jgi:hypothetical protein
MNIRDRIKAHRRIRAGDLVPHEFNFRTHGPVQRAALDALYCEVGLGEGGQVRIVPKLWRSSSPVRVGSPIGFQVVRLFGKRYARVIQKRIVHSPGLDQGNRLTPDH